MQLSVFECEVRSQDELRALRAEIHRRIDTLEDQVRLYPTTTHTFTDRYIIGARVVEERSDYAAGLSSSQPSAPIPLSQWEILLNRYAAARFSTARCTRQVVRRSCPHR